MSKQIKLVYPPKFESSNIEQLGFLAEADLLIIGFVGGGTYAYLDFVDDDWAQVVETVTNGESVGKYFHRTIKNKYDYLKLAGGPLVDLWPSINPSRAKG
jgi:hypothetical protein